MENLNLLENTETKNSAEKLSIREKGTEKTANILLLDCSESTEEQIGRGDSRQKIIGIQEAASLFVSSLPPSCYVSVIVFSSSATLLWPMQKLSENKLSIIQKVQHLSPCGTTAMKEALSIAREQLLNAPQDYVERAYVLTDGKPDRDPTEEAEALKNAGARLYAIGFGEGEEINLSLLEDMATITDEGKKLFYHFVDIQKMSLLFKKESKTIQN